MFLKIMKFLFKNYALSYKKESSNDDSLYGYLIVFARLRVWSLIPSANISSSE